MPSLTTKKCISKYKTSIEKVYFLNTLYFSILQIVSKVGSSFKTSSCRLVNNNSSNHSYAYNQYIVSYDLYVGYNKTKPIDIIFNM